MKKRYLLCLLCLVNSWKHKSLLCLLCLVNSWKNKFLPRLLCLAKIQKYKSLLCLLLFGFRYTVFSLVSSIIFNETLFIHGIFVESTLLHLIWKKTLTTCAHILDHTFINFRDIVHPPCLFRTTLLFGPLEY